MKNKEYYVYILKCIDDTFYIGYTTNIDERIKTHNKGIGAKYTRGRTPVKLVYYEVFQEKGNALKREHILKKLSRKQKEKLIDLE